MTDALFEGEVIDWPSPMTTAADGVELHVAVDRWAGQESWSAVGPTRCLVRVFDDLADEVGRHVEPGQRVVVAGHRASPWSFGPVDEHTVRARSISVPLPPRP